MADGLLMRSQSDDFRMWLVDQGYTVRNGRGSYQVFQVKDLNSNMWYVLYEISKHGGAFYRIDTRVAHLVSEYREQLKGGTWKGPTTHTYEKLRLQAEAEKESQEKPKRRRTGSVSKKKSSTNKPPERLRKSLEPAPPATGEDLF